MKYMRKVLLICVCVTCWIIALFLCGKSITSSIINGWHDPEFNSHTRDAVTKDENITNQVPQQLPADVKKMLERKLSANDKEVLMDLLKTFKDLAERLNITYMMHSGTLIGSWRHHGLIPWDDDIDILVNEKQKPQLLDAIKKLEPAYIGPDTKPIVKFYSRNSTLQIKGKRWRWPFIDVCFFRENDIEIWDTLGDYQRIKYKKSKIFPLHKRPFEQFELNAPKDTLYYFEETYQKTGYQSLSTCITHYLSHRLEGITKTYSMKCEKLKYIVPFVHRRVVNGKMEETLMLGDKVVHVRLVSEDPSNISGPYELTRKKD